jgi:hypothetical protein
MVNESRIWLNLNILAGKHLKYSNALKKRDLFDQWYQLHCVLGRGLPVRIAAQHLTTPIACKIRRKKFNPMILVITATFSNYN